MNEINNVNDLPLANEFCKFGDFVIYTIGDAKSDEIDTKQDNKKPNTIKFKGGKSSRNILKINKIKS